MAKWIRKNIGTIIASMGLVLLVILTFGDLGELFTEQYWKNVGGNLTAIGALTVGLVMVQVAIKQGVSEQALSNGLNTENTLNKYKEHKEILFKCREKEIYLPYFLALRNERETKRRKREFLVSNNFTSEIMLRTRGDRKLNRKYDKIKTVVTVDNIKWSTTEIVYTKYGAIEKLETYRKKRTVKAVFIAIFFMFATTLIVGGMFLDRNDIPVWQKIIKFGSYLISMVMPVIFDSSANYEKGAFGVPNELDEINNIWYEFDLWTVPQWAIEEVKTNENQITDDKKFENIEVNGDKKFENIEVKDGRGSKERKSKKAKESENSRTGIQKKQAKVKDIQVFSSDNIL
jgi:hypothetical protein